MNTFKSKLKVFGTTFAIALVAIVASANFAAAQGPDVVFNNGSGVAGVGEEKNFLRIGDANGGNTTEACNEGQTVDLWFYVHNTNPTELNGPNNDGIGVARNTKVDLSFKNSGFLNSQEVDASVKADNSALAEDNAFITCQGQAISLEYVSQSLFTNAPAGAVPYTLTGNIMDKATLGYNGVVPGCFDFRAFITVKVKVHLKPVPVFTCDLLTVSKLADNKFRFVASYTANNGATFKDVTYNVNDGTSFSGTETADHTFAAFNGSKNVTATVNFTVNGQPQTNSNEKCVVAVSSKIVTPPVTPKPTSLPNTGAGSTIAIFGATSILGAFLYRMRALRGTK